MAGTSTSTFEDVFQKYGYIESSSASMINANGVVVPPQGTAMSGVMAAGNGNGFSDQNIEDAWKILSVYRATVDSSGAANAEYMWLYNAMICHFFKRANSIVVAGGELEASSSQASAEKSALDEDRKRFREQKNRLITLISKNQNIASKYQRSYLYTWLLFLMLVLYGFAMTTMIMDLTGLDKRMNDTVVLSLSSIVLCVILFFKIYRAVVSFNLEAFTEPSTACPDTLTDVAEVKPKLMDILDNYLSSYKILNDYKNMVGDTGTVEQRKVINTILNDYNNVNYVNMRKYQLTDYRLESTMHNRRFVMYGFVLISIIGLLSATLTDTGPMSGMFSTISTALICMYIVTYLLYVRQNKSRKRYNWNKLYWVLNKGDATK